MNEHTGFHEYKDGKRFNPECLVCLKEEEQEKKWIFEGSLLMLKEAIEAR